MSSKKRPAWAINNFRYYSLQDTVRICMAKIDTTKCVGCGGCIDICPVIAIAMIQDVVTVDPEICTKCGICIKVCPVRAPFED
jgi:ferredoxin